VTLRVLTWNLWWRFGPWEQRRNAIVETIRAAAPDVLCLQEVWAHGSGAGMAAILADELGYHAVSSATVGRSEVGFTNAVLARWPADLLADEALPCADGSPGYRRVVAARVITPWGGWPIASAHLDHRFDGSLTRQRQCRRLLELAAELRGDPTTDLPVIIGADINAVPDSAEVRLLTGREPGEPGIVFSDAWEQCGTGAGWTWTSENPHCTDTAWPNRRLDYVLVSWPRPRPTGNPVAAFVVGDGPIDVRGVAVWPSDHAAVVVDIRTPGDDEQTSGR
jgi:endonuclease/exonuclease/phosphatase family metal-dependent hydrolase